MGHESDVEVSVIPVECPAGLSSVLRTEQLEVDAIGDHVDRGRQVVGKCGGEFIGLHDHGVGALGRPLRRPYPGRGTEAMSVEVLPQEICTTE